MVILGGDRAFAAGNYDGSMLEVLSPLSSSPPQPVTQWLLVTDSSGSMSAALGDNTRLHFAVNAIMQLIPLLPPEDSVAVGNFAQALRWWAPPRPVREAAKGIERPRDLQSGGPTNLAPALRVIAAAADGAAPTQLLLITDAEAKVDDAADLAAALLKKRVTVHVLTAGAASADGPVQQIVKQTGGQLIEQKDPRRWAQDLRTMMRSAAAPQRGDGELTIRFTDAGPKLPPMRANAWNRTWLKADAVELASGESKAGPVPAAAGWNLGAGAVIATAFATDERTARTLADRVLMPPRDPRFKLSWDAAEELRVTLSAADEKSPMNDLDVRIELTGEGQPGNDEIAIPQIAPGRYELKLPAPARSRFATVFVAGRVLDRFAVCGRYPPEFDRIGNDRAALEALARSTGGAVIEPSQTRPIDFHWPIRTIPLAPWLAAAGAMFSGAGLIAWKFRA